MDLYSVTLGLAIAATSCAVGLTLVSRLPSWRDAESPRRSAVARNGAAVTGVTALTLVILSAVFHVGTGHTPGSSTALGPAAFLAMHPALAVTVVMAAVPLAVLRITRARIGGAR